MSETASIAQQVEIWLATSGSTLDQFHALNILADRSVQLLRPKDLIDPWDRPYVLRRTEDGRVEVVSFGADGEIGGRGDDSDVVGVVGG